MDSIKSLEVQIANGHQSGVDILLTSQWPKGVENGAASLVVLRLIYAYQQINKILFSFLRMMPIVRNLAQLF